MGMIPGLLFFFSLACPWLSQNGALAFSRPTIQTHSTLRSKNILSDLHLHTHTVPSLNVITDDWGFLPDTKATRISSDENLLNCASMLLSHRSHVADAAPSSDQNASLLDINTLLSNPSFWAVVVMLSIVGLLYTWEESIHYIRKSVPKPLSPVIDSMLGEVGGLGFIGLFLELFVTRYPNRGLGGVVGELSERFLGEQDILLEAFESLHSLFFEVGVAFFAVTGTIVGGVLLRINDLSNISKFVLDTDGDGEASLEEIASAIDAEVITVDLDGDGILTKEEKLEALRNIPPFRILPELFLSPTQRASEMLLIRERLLSQRNENKHEDENEDGHGNTHRSSENDFQIETYFEQIFGKKLKQMVELSPLTWLPLIPLLSILNSVDLSNEIVSASSPNAWVSSGCFITSPYFVTISSASTFLCLGWGIWNFWKLTSIKQMLLPTLVRDGDDESGNREAILLPPRYENDTLRNAFSSSPGMMTSIERILGGNGMTPSSSLTASSSQPLSRHDQLFGASGSNGPDLYLRSIQFHTWLCVASSVFFMGQIVVRDIFTLVDYDNGNGILALDEIGNMDMVVPELGLYSIYVILLVGQMIIAPTVFLNYCTATSIEEMTQGWAMEKARVNE